jgi:hypothetical protein
MHRLRSLSLLLPLLLALGCQTERGNEAATDGGSMAPSRDMATAPVATDPTSRYSVPGEGVEEGSQQPKEVPAPDASAPAPPTGGDTAGGAPGGAARPVIPQMIIRTGTAVVRVDSLEAAMAQVEQLARRLGGYIANSTVQSGSENVRQATMEMKLPADRWSQALGGLKPIGELESQQTSTEDVGEEFVDITARMENARRLETRLLELLGTRTGRLSDVLAVERELSRVREQIERAEGRLRYLRSRVSVSTLTIQLHEPSPVLAPGQSPIMDALRQAWRNFVNFTAGLIASLGWMIPLALVLAALIWLLRRLFGRRGPGAGPRRWPWRANSPPPGPPPPAGPM